VGKQRSVLLFLTCGSFHSVPRFCSARDLSSPSEAGIQTKYAQYLNLQFPSFLPTDSAEDPNVLMQAHRKMSYEDAARGVLKHNETPEVLCL
jgi:hypothetical protein